MEHLDDRDTGTIGDPLPGTKCAMADKPLADDHYPVSLLFGLYVVS